jgi:hypothetical protein
MGLINPISDEEKRDEDRLETNLMIGAMAGTAVLATFTLLNQPNQSKAPPSRMQQSFQHYKAMANEIVAHHPIMTLTAVGGSLSMMAAFVAYKAFKR